MKHHLFFPIVASILFIALLGASLAIWKWSHAPQAQIQGAYVAPSAPPLVVDDAAPIGLIGTVTALGTDTVTITGKPQGNAEPVVLTVAVDNKTSITKVGAAPAYATSTANFSDFKKGMLLNIVATEVKNDVRHAERIIIPPATQ